MPGGGAVGTVRAWKEEGVGKAGVGGDEQADGELEAVLETELVPPSFSV